jgi:hypothetical protein
MFLFLLFLLILFIENSIFLSTLHFLINNKLNLMLNIVITNLTKISLYLISLLSVNMILNVSLISSHLVLDIVSLNNPFPFNDLIRLVTLYFVYLHLYHLHLFPQIKSYPFCTLLLQILCPLLLQSTLVVFDFIQQMLFLFVH